MAERKQMCKIDSEQIAYYGKSINTMTKDELIRALEELAGAIRDCAVKNKRCAEIIKVHTGLECGED